MTFPRLVSSLPALVSRQVFRAKTIVQLAKNAINGARVQLSVANRRRVQGLYNAHQGEQCVVVLSGPSLKEVDLSLVAEHPFVMGVNAAYRVHERFKYYFCSSANFYVPNAGTLLASNTDIFFLSHAIPFRSAENRVYVRLNYRCMAHEQQPGEFLYDLTERLCWGPTVLLDLVLPACLWMGFSEIILLGADYTLDDYRRFYDGDHDAPRRVGPADSLREMHLAHLGMDRLVEFLQAREQTTTIYNCSPLSHLPHFPKPNLADVISSR